MANTFKGSSKPAPKRTNPFDLKHQRPPKYAVLNSNKSDSSSFHKHGSSSSVGRPAHSKSHALELRKNTLLKELKEEGKAGKFIDKRIRHNKSSTGINTEMSKMQRFLMAKQASSRVRKTQKYNDILKDEDETSTKPSRLLTHRGRELKDDSDFESEPEDYDLLVDDRYEQGENFGNFLEDNGNRGTDNGDKQKKTKAEVMQEVIAKSKMHKLKRQQLKEENEALCDAVNQDFDQLRDEIVKTHGVMTEQSRETKSMGAYETLMRELQFDKKVKPGDRRKTEEEMEREKVAKEEAKRARMTGAEDGSSNNLGSTKDTLGRLDREMMTALDAYLGSENKKNAQLTYKALKDRLEDGQNVIALARAIRAEVGSTFSVSPKDVNIRRLVLMLQLVNRIFSTSDAHHLVVTPCSLLACRQLMNLALFGGDTATLRLGLAIAWILIEYQKESRRWLSEVANYLGFVLARSGNKSSRIMIFGKDAASAFHNSDENEDKTTSTITLQSLIFKKPDILVSARILVHRLISLYNPRPKSSLIDESLIIKPAGSAHITPKDRLSILPEIISYFNGLDEKLEIDMVASRDKMRMLDSAPVPLPSLNPELEDSYLPGRLRSDNTRNSKERSKKEDLRETASLKRALKKETKGARRELQKDAHFLARERASERKTQDLEYQGKIKRIYGDIANDAAGIKDRKKRKF